MTTPNALAPLPPAPAALGACGGRLRPATADDLDAQRAVYVAGRWEEMRRTGWPEAAILAFLADQFALQTRQYAEHYADAARLIVEVDGRPVGRVILYDTGAEIRVVKSEEHTSEL